MTTTGMTTYQQRFLFGGVIGRCLTQNGSFITLVRCKFVTLAPYDPSASCASMAL